MYIILNAHKAFQFVMIPFLDIKKITDLHRGEIQQAITRVLDSGWFLNGKELNVFEKNYSRFIGSKYCVGVGNGFDALNLIFKAYINMGVMSEGDEVIVQANTFIATVLAITQAGLNPVFADVDSETLAIREDSIQKLISKKTKAVLIVHLYGRCAYSEQIGAICKQYNLKLIEDNAQAQGCMYGQYHTGALGDVAAHSFYPGKNLGAMGDAGAVTTNDEMLAHVIRTIGNYGSEKKYYSVLEGRNSRLDELQASILNVKLKYLDEENIKRKEIASAYYKNITNPDVMLPSLNDCRDSVYHIFPIFTNKRDALKIELEHHHVHTLIHYPVPPHKQQCFKMYNKLSLPVTEMLASMELSLPISQVMTKEEAEFVSNIINTFQ